MRSLVVFLVSVLAFGSAAAQAQPAVDAAFVNAAQMFQRALNGEKSEVATAISAFQALVAADQKNPLYEAYLGSASSLRGRDAWMPWNKMSYTEDGLDHIDRALAMLKPEHDKQLTRGSPVGIETRLVAANAFLKVPDAFFHRAAAGRRLIADILKNPAFAGSPATLRASVYLLAADAVKGSQVGEEISHLKQALALAGTGKQAEQARARLKELGQ